MYDIHLNSIFSSKSLEEIKLLSLYYDKINIIDDATYSPGYNKETNKLEVIRHSFVPASFQADYKVLIDEGILKIIEGDDDDDFAKEISQTINQCEDVIFPQDSKGHRTLTSEVFSVLSDVKNCDLEKDGVDRGFLWWFYAKKLQRSVKTLLDGKTCISSSSSMDKLLNHFVKQNYERLTSQPDIKLSNINLSPLKTGIALSLPSPRDLSFEDILYLKAQLHDERVAFQHELAKIQRKAIETGVTQSELQSYLHVNIESPVQDLKGKISGLKRNSLRKFIKNIQNPLAYSPLIGTFMSNLPLQVTAAISLGLITIDTALEYAEDNKKLQKSSLSFLLKIKG